MAKTPARPSIQVEGSGTPVGDAHAVFVGGPLAGGGVAVAIQDVIAIRRLVAGGRDEAGDRVREQGRAIAELQFDFADVEAGTGVVRFDGDVFAIDVGVPIGIGIAGVVELGRGADEVPVCMGQVSGEAGGHGRAVGEVGVAGDGAGELVERDTVQPGKRANGSGWHGANGDRRH